MYQLRKPALALQPFIEHYWFVTPDAGPMALQVDVFVDARADLVFNLGDPWLREIIGGESSHHDGPCLDAHRLFPIRIHQRGRVRVSGVRFRMGGLAPFARVPLYAITNRTLLPEEVFDPAIRLVGESLSETALDVHAATFDAFFTANLVSGAGQLAFGRALDRLRGSDGTAPLGDLAAEAGCSLRQLDRLFRHHLGIPPKTAARVLRFQRAMRALMVAPDRALADVAVEAGYFDHAHFIKEFRRMTGGVPRGYRGYYPPDAPNHFAPNLVVFLQDGALKTMQDSPHGADPTPS